MALAPSSTTSAKQTENSKQTLLGAELALEQRFGLTPRNDVSTTMNSLMRVFPNQVPANNANKDVLYFGIGVGGRLADSSTNLVSAQPVLGTNMGLYMPRPFRAVPIETDLSPTERAQYGMRVIETHNGQRYACYYLKRIAFSTLGVSFDRVDPASGNTVPYELNPQNLSPTPPVAGSNGVIVDVADAVAVTVPAVLSVTGEEVLESAAVIDGGDARLAVVSEIGFYSASPEMVQGLDAANNQFPYTEAIMAQLVEHYTFDGFSFRATTDEFRRTIRFSVRNLINT
jgi:hypothetical protein